MIESIWNEFVNFTSGNQIISSIFIIVIGGYWQYRRYTDEWNFKNYHQLIRDLNQSDTPGEQIKLFRQVAIVYELRNYPRYFSVTKRILSNWLKDKKDIEGMDGHLPLYSEMEKTIKYIEAQSYLKYLNYSLYK